MTIFRHALVAVLVFFAAQAYAGELKLAHFMPPTHPMDTMVMAPMTEAFNRAEGVTSEIRIFAAGELGKGPQQQYKRVATGAADIAFVLPAFT
ncbi:MAG: ABC transporter substrate-binding protein, partial [Pseudomonadota bacterium]